MQDGSMLYAMRTKPDILWWNIFLKCFDRKICFNENEDCDTYTGGHSLLTTKDLLKLNWAINYIE